MSREVQPTSDDAALIRAFLASRSEEAFRALYRVHTPYLFALSLRLAGGRREEAEEALQDAWIRAAERLAAFRGGSTLRTWLAGILINCTREARRRRRPEVVDLAEWEAVAARTAPPPGAALAVDLERALAELPEVLRDIVVLFDLEGLTHEEVGQRLGIPAGTSKSRLSLARRVLRARLIPEPRPANPLGERA
jgi:RNA polymerase sigma-70 factor (ECF subfamily)